MTTGKLNKFIKNIEHRIATHLTLSAELTGAASQVEVAKAQALAKVVLDLRAEIDCVVEQEDFLTKKECDGIFREYIKQIFPKTNFQEHNLPSKDFDLNNLDNG